MTLQSTAVVSTDRPERYIKQLISHMGHKCETTLTETGGSITVRSGHCDLTAEPGAIVMTATAADAESLAAVEDVVARHLVRFGTKDELLVTWSAAGA